MSSHQEDHSTSCNQGSLHGDPEEAGDVGVSCSLHVHYQQDLDYNTATLDELQSVSAWMDQLGDNPDEETVQVHRDNLNKRPVDPGFGLPDFHLDLARRGRIDAPGGASSTFYEADNVK